MKTVSVIIPAHNSSATLIEALDSVVNQTYPISEIIVVDDASIDDTVEVFKAWEAKVKTKANIELICHHQNTGPAGARNHGIRKASGEWVAFLDGDDAWLAGKTEAQLNTAQRHPDADMLCGRSIPLTLDEANFITTPTFGAVPLTLDDFITHNPVTTSTVMARRKVLLDAGLFDEQFRGPEDYDLWLRIASQHECLDCETTLARYRTTSGSLSMDDRTFLPQVLAVLEKAFAPGGALAEHSGQRRLAFAEQYSSASWMAYNRQDRRTALCHLFRSWYFSPRRIHKERTEDRWLRLKLLARYLGLA
jgi:teichuronic acid biosynthesis glycosyltransferase TuaG